jgi:hypothetical protein
LRGQVVVAQLQPFQVLEAGETLYLGVPDHTRAVGE